MRPFRSISAICAMVLSLASMASAQTAPPPADLSPLQTAVACAPPASTSGEPAHALHVVGAQDTTARSLFGSRDLLIVDGGTKAGVQLDQEFFVRREARFGMAYRPKSQKARSEDVRTVGWIHIVAVNESNAVAVVRRACDGIMANDYLEPFAVPVVPDGADRDEAPGEPDFSSLGRIVVGTEDRRTGGAGDFMLIDRGSAQGVTPGARYAIYRDVSNFVSAGLPLAAVGEAIVISTGTDTALTRITRSRDAIMTGDYVALRK
jgi:hypothetical protein